MLVTLIAVNRLPLEILALAPLNFTMKKKFFMV